MLEIVVLNYSLMLQVFNKKKALEKPSQQHKNYQSL